MKVSGWKLYEDLGEHASVLEHGLTRARAWFSHHDFRHPLIGNYIGGEDDPFNSLAAAIRAGLRPFKVEGAIASLTPPFDLAQGELAPPNLSLTYDRALP